MVSWIQAHKKESIIIGISMLFFILILIFFKIFFFSSSRNVYGDRLDDIQRAKISKDKLQKVSEELTEYTGVEKVDAFITGRVINLFVEIKSEAVLDELKNVSIQSIENFSAKEKELYDIQVYFVGEGENYPAIGYKGKDDGEFTWVNS